MRMRCPVRLLGILATLVAGMTVGSGVLISGAAYATPCGTAIVAGATCTMTGTVTLTGGTLTLASASSLTWTGTLNGLDQSLVDVVAGDQQYTVNDATGSGAGWHVTTSATTFTNGAHTFPNSGTFVTNGSVTSITDTTRPTATCTATCTLPTNSTTYPIAIMTAPLTPTAATIYDTALATGMGEIVIGGSAAANPIGWWVNVPASASAGSYTSTITMEIISGP
ncbi:MAG TPA: hypothetical protein VMU94_07005 [Streptosporangiaceae bacterium]|nr:hypothetical protein [Streptosporangiaceae bacterium]